MITLICDHSSYRLMCFIIDHMVVRATSPNNFDPTIPLWISMVHVFNLFTIDVFFLFVYSETAASSGGRIGVSADAARLWRYVQAAKEGQNGEDCRILYQACNMIGLWWRLTSDSPLLINQKQTKKKKQIEKI